MDGHTHTTRHGSLFAEDFDLPQGSPVPKPVEPVFSAEELAVARESAWREGYDAGLLEAAASDTASIRQTIAQIGAHLHTESEAAALRAEQHAESIGQLLLSSLAATFPA